MAPSDPAQRASVAARLVIDHWTLRTVAAFTEHGIDSVLLKGPAVARWLYDDPLERDYSDADLLVRCSDLPEARAALAELGFRRSSDPMTAPWESAAHAETWSGPGSRAEVDLHRCLHGLEQQPGDLVFDAIWRERDHLDLRGSRVAVPSESWRLLHLVLHVQPKDQPGSQAWTDLERALQRFDEDAWRRAAHLAAVFEILDTMGPLLRLVPDGDAMADRLDLPVAPNRALVLHHRRNAPGLVHFALRLRALGPGAAPRVIRMALAPPAAGVRATYPIARRGTLGLAAAYAWRVLRLPALAWRAARHQAARRSQPRLR